MARIRTVKPEFWSSEQVVSCSIPARLLFIGLWNFCDDSGVHEAKPRRIKMEIFPDDDLSPDEIQALIDELIDQDLVRRYSAGDRDYLIVTGWHHQRIDQPTFKHPLPCGTVPSSPFRRRREGQA